MVAIEEKSAGVVGTEGWFGCSIVQLVICSQNLKTSCNFNAFNYNIMCFSRAWALF